MITEPAISVADTLAFPFRSPRWGSKLLIAALLSIAGLFTFFITSLFLNGYFVRLMRQVIQEGDQPRLPEWDDWGKLFVDGLKITVAGLIFSLPIFIVFGIGYASYFVPLMLGTASRSEETMLTLMMLGMGSGWCLFGIGMLLTLLWAFLIPPALAQLVKEDSFAGAFHFRSWWAVLRSGFWGFVASVVVLFGMLGFFSLIYNVLIFTFLLCWLAPFLLLVMSVYAGLVYFAMIGQAYRSGSQNLAKPAMLVAAEA